MNQRAGGTSLDSVSVTLTKSTHWADNGPLSVPRLLLEEQQQQQALFSVHSVRVGMSHSSRHPFALG